MASDCIWRCLEDWGDAVEETSVGEEDIDFRYVVLGFEDFDGSGRVGVDCCVELDDDDLAVFAYWNGAQGVGGG